MPVMEPRLILWVDPALMNLVDSVVLLYPPLLGIGWHEVTQRQDVYLSDYRYSMWVYVGGEMKMMMAT